MAGVYVLLSLLVYIFMARVYLLLLFLMYGLLLYICIMYDICIVSEADRADQGAVQTGERKVSIYIPSIYCTHTSILYIIYCY